MAEAKNKNRTFGDILKEEPLVLVDFFTTWCGPCKMLKPILEELHSKVGNDVKILKVDVDKNPKAADIYQIRGVPTLKLFKHGKVVWTQSGVVPVATLQQVINKFKS
jgi:thioredoxin 1